jgi:protein-disulfide isomerase
MDLRSSGLVGLVFVWGMMSAAVARAGAASADVPAAPGIAVDASDSAALGPKNAPVTIVEFADFQCPYSAQASRTLKGLLLRYPNQVRWVFKHYPLRIHPGAPLAHEAALAAGEQGKFWEMHDLLFRNQNRLNRHDLVAYAAELNLDLTAFREALESRRLRHRVVRDLNEGRRHLQVGVTPTFFINGKRVAGARPLSELRQLIERELSALTSPATPAAE